MEFFQLEFPRDDEDSRKALETLDTSKVSFIEPNYFTGDPQVTVAVIGLAATTITVVGHVVVSCVNRGKHAKIKIDGMEFAGSAVSDGLEILKAREKARDAG